MNQNNARSLQIESVTAEALDCISAADVFVGSEDEFSQAAALLSRSVKVLTDKWRRPAQVHESDDMVISLDVANTIAGVGDATRAELNEFMKEWRECSSQATSRNSPAMLSTHEW